MKKFISKILIMSVVCVLLTGCGKKEEKVDNAVKDDLVEFVSVELVSVQEERDSAIEQYNEYFSKEGVSPDEFLTTLELETVPKLTSYIDKLNALEVSTDEVKELKELFVNSTNKQLEAMNFVVIALKDKDTESLNKATTCLDESKTFLSQYEAKLKQLANDYDVEIVGEFTTIQDVEQTSTEQTSTEQTSTEQTSTEQTTTQ